MGEILQKKLAKESQYDKIKDRFEQNPNWIWGRPSPNFQKITL
jgi:hypothetical protein